MADYTDHRQEALDLLAAVDVVTSGVQAGVIRVQEDEIHRAFDHTLRVAQVHATLALVDAVKELTRG